MSLPCQTGFSFLSVPDLQSVCAQGDFNQDIIPRKLNCNAVKEEDVKCSANKLFNRDSIHPKACALLAAANSFTDLHADALDADVMDLDVSDCPSPLETVSDKYDPERPLPPRALLRMAPPKRFYRTFWRSVARRLVRQWVNEVWPAALSASAVPSEVWLDGSLGCQAKAAISAQQLQR